jgi:hypothetical protein
VKEGLGQGGGANNSQEEEYAIGYELPSTQTSTLFAGASGF